MPSWHPRRMQWELEGEEFRGSSIAQLKRNLRLSYAEMASLVGCSSGTITRWCNTRERNQNNSYMRAQWSNSLAYLYMINRVGINNRHRISAAFYQCRQLDLDDRGRVIPDVLRIGALHTNQSWADISARDNLQNFEHVVTNSAPVTEEEEDDIDEEEDDYDDNLPIEEFDTELDFSITEHDEDNDETPALLINLRSKRLDPSNAEQLEEMSAFVAKTLQRSLHGKLYVPQKRVMLLRVQLETYDSLIRILSEERKKLKDKLSKLGDDYYE